MFFQLVKTKGLGHNPEFVRTLAGSYAILVLVLVGLVPAIAIAYLYFSRIRTSLRKSQLS